MGYTKTWIPPSVPFRADLNAWKINCNDIHDNLLLAGLVQTSDPGQLDIDGVEELPADGTFEGHRIYRFDDDLQATSPIFIKLEFGCGVEGAARSGYSVNARTQTMRIRITVSNATDNDDIVTLSPSIVETYPQSISPNTTPNTTQLVSAGTSHVCFNAERGFFGFVYGAGSRNYPMVGTIGSYIGCSLAFFIQRDLVDGIPTSSGFSVFLASTPKQDYTNLGPVTGVTHYGRYWKVTSGSNSTTYSNRAAVRPFTTITNPIGNNPQLHPIAILDGNGSMSYCPTLFSYRTQDIGDGNVIDVALAPGGATSKFIALGPYTQFRTDHDSVEDTSIAMLYE